MTERQILQIMGETGALLEGHFELRSKLHSNRYFQCANVLRYPRIAEKLCRAVTREVVKSGKLGKRIDGVISPAVGGILVGHEVARELGVKCIFAEKVQGEGTDASGKPNTVLALRRFSIKKGERYVVAEDVVTKGGRVQETIDLVKAAGGSVAGVVVLVDRSAGKVKFGRVPMFSLMQMTPETWTADECPMCKAGSKPVHPGS
ncbi:MAG: orotate phosphoribosyltransferase [Kiritimatiellae bacterium]|nr:orotate phosphoribosyltransferase [Kiritimatiellia bacterium]